MKVLEAEDRQAERPREELLALTGMLADQALNKIFKPEADAAIAHPGEILTEFITSPEQRQWQDQVREYGGDPVSDSVELQRHYRFGLLYRRLSWRSSAGAQPTLRRSLAARGKAHQQCEQRADRRPHGIEAVTPAGAKRGVEGRL